MVVYYYFGFYKVILLNFVIMRFDEILWCSFKEYGFMFEVLWECLVWKWFLRNLFVVY